LLEKRVLCSELRKHAGQEVTIAGWLRRVRRVGRQLAFWVVQDRSGWAQAVLAGELGQNTPPLESVVRIEGMAVTANSAQGVELQARAVEVLSFAQAELPFEINQPEIKAGLDLQLDHRVLSLRHPAAQAVFRIQSTIGEAFRRYLLGQGLVEVHTPKIVATGTEGGAELFPVQYFEQSAFLAQSPQFYKQMLVAAGFERVFEVAPAFRAEEHNTSRHTNEFTSLDLEMGFVEHEDTLMNLEEALLKFVVQEVQGRHAAELELLGVTLPTISRIPRVTLAAAQGILQERYGHSSPAGNLDPQGEKLLCQYAEEEHGTSLIFVTHYPAAHRPFYALPCADDPELTHSFDLLCKGVEVTTGGLRIHRAEQLRTAMQDRGLEPAAYGFYLEAFELGAPPHGGFAIGLERLTARLLDLDNLRQATLFPRDRTRLVP
jgi:nondiscriminating aspartyl-tRNA synthetase